MLNIVNPPGLPDPTGMNAILAAIQNGNLFHDMSGLAGTIGLAQAAGAEAGHAATEAAGRAAADAATAAQLGTKVAEIAADLRRVGDEGREPARRPWRRSEAGADPVTRRQLEDRLDAQLRQGDERARHPAHRRRPTGRLGRKRHGLIERRPNLARRHDLAEKPGHRADVGRRSDEHGARSGRSVHHRRQATPEPEASVGGWDWLIVTQYAGLDLAAPPVGLIQEAGSRNPPFAVQPITDAWGLANFDRYLVEIKKLPVDRTPAPGSATPSSSVRPP